MNPVDRYFFANWKSDVARRDAERFRLAGPLEVFARFNTAVLLPRRPMLDC